MLYPLFVHNIGALLYHPTNQARQSIGNAAMAARGRPEQQQDYMRTPQGTQPPALTHHHSMTTPVGAGMPQPPHSIAPHPAPGRPGIDRAHTFPTPPTSATSLTMGMGNAGSQYEYSGAHAASMHSGQPLSIDTGMNARSVPTTPATTLLAIRKVCNTKRASPTTTLGRCTRRRRLLAGTRPKTWPDSAACNPAQAPSRPRWARLLELARRTSTMNKSRMMGTEAIRMRRVNTRVNIPTPVRLMAPDDPRTIINLTQRQDLCIQILRTSRQR